MQLFILYNLSARRAIHTHRGMKFISQISEDYVEMYDYVDSDCHDD